MPFEKEDVLRDGRRVPVLIASSLLPGYTDRGVAFAIDLTERKRTEQALHESKGRNLAILRAIPDLMFIQDKDGVYLDYHAKDGSQLLVPPEQFLGKNMREVLPSGLAHRLAQCFKLALQSGDTQVFEYGLPIRGTDRWYEARIVRSNGDKLLSIVRDITERKHAEDAVRQSEDFSRAVLSSLPTHIAVLDKDGIIVAVNEAWLAFGRYNGAASQAAISIGANYLDVYRKAVGSASGIARKALAGICSILDGSAKEFELKYQCGSSSEPRWFLMTVTPFKSSTGARSSPTSISVSRSERNKRFGKAKNDIALSSRIKPS